MDFLENAQSASPSRLAVSGEAGLPAGEAGWRIKKTLASATRVLVVPGQNGTMDTLPASLGLAEVLNSLGKKAFIGFDGSVPSYIKFLNFEGLLTSLTETSLDAFDCIATIGTGNYRTRLDSFDFAQGHGEHSRIHDLAGRTVINVGTHNMDASSYSEAMTRLIKEILEESLTPAVATSLLTGIIARTDNFKGNNVTPHTLFSAAYLITRGAEREKVIDFLYKKRPVSFLKLWGKFLLDIEYDGKTGVVWGILSPEDFGTTAGPDIAVPWILKELTSTVPEALAQAVLWKDGIRPGFQAVIHADRRQVLDKLSEHLGAVRHGNNLYIASTEKGGHEIASIISGLTRA